MADDARAALCVGLAGWGCRLTADTEAGRAEIVLRGADWTVPDEGRPMTVLSVHLTAGPLPRLRLTVDGRPADFSPFFEGPEGKRFIPVADPVRRLYADRATGDRAPVLELCDGGLSVLRPHLWPAYILHAATWRLLCEHPVVALHAAVCAVDGVALVVVGPSGCGKSTLSWALARHGADYFSDDGAFFGVDSARLHVLPHRARLRPGGVARLDDAPQGIHWHEAKTGDPKFVADLPAPRSPCPERPVVLYFVEGFADEPRLSLIGGGEATRRVFRAMAYGERSVPARMETAAGLVSRLQCWSLTIGRPRETAEMLAAHAGHVRRRFVESGLIGAAR